MSKETFDKFYKRYQQEEVNISRQLQNYAGEVSNLHELIQYTVELSSKLAVVWSSGDIRVKENLQNLIFPEGIVFDRKIGSFRTPKVNLLFQAIPDLNNISSDNEKGTNHNNCDLSLVAEREGFELFNYSPVNSLITKAMQKATHQKSFLVSENTIIFDKAQITRFFRKVKIPQKISATNRTEATFECVESARIESLSNFIFQSWHFRF